MNENVDKVRSLVYGFQQNPKRFESELKAMLPRLTSIYECLKSICSEREDIRDGLFLTLYHKKKKMEIVSSFLNVDADKILMSPRAETVISMGSFCKMYDTLYEVYKTTSNYEVFSLSDIVFGWTVINTTAMGIDLITNSFHEEYSSFTEDVRKALDESKAGEDFLFKAVDKVAEATTEEM